MASAQKIITTMQSRGFELTLTTAGGLAVTPASRLSDSERVLIRDNRAAILAHLTAANDAKAPIDQTAATSPDAYTWPHSDAMNAAELAQMVTRLASFQRLGFDIDQAERMADKLLIRDREWMDMAMCVECQHLTGGMGNFRCRAYRSSGATDTGLPRDLVEMLQRCPVFRD